MLTLQNICKQRPPVLSLLHTKNMIRTRHSNSWPKYRWQMLFCPWHTSFQWLIPRSDSERKRVRARKKSWSPKLSACSSVALLIFHCCVSGIYCITISFEYVVLVLPLYCLHTCFETPEKYTGVPGQKYLTFTTGWQRKSIANALELRLSCTILTPR